MKYVLNAELVKKHLDQSGWSLLRIAEETKTYFDANGFPNRNPISERTLRNALGGKPIELKTALAIAHVLKTDLAIIEWTRLSPWEASAPRTSEFWSADWSDGLKKNMAGEYENALKIFNDVLSRLPEETEISVKLELMIQRGIAIDQAGYHDKACTEFRTILDEIERIHPLRTSLAFWAQYHLGIALRRNEAFSDARRELIHLLESVRKTPSPTGSLHPFQPSVLHQLGALALTEARAHNGDQRELCLEEAMAWLTNADEDWAYLFEHDMPVDGHRRGYTLSRLGETQAEKGNQASAAHFFFEAVSIFSWYKCDRYVENTRHLYRQFILAPMEKLDGK